MKKNTNGLMNKVLIVGVFGGANKIDVLTNLFSRGIDEIWTTNSYHKDLIEYTDFKFPNLHILPLENFV